ncbi:hypothetical protein QJS10_CPB11g00063 [Acorus calamus]|uniref:BZIP domain-containing protein n=1 Tax=Acorus calamus TaxID=4465 RepID=A0AAV9DSD9_ACOCL|nr:hypothetical protein QJS10_CPB11g00063 [Acorus calamus]
MPSMEMLGFKNISQPFRVDSEELFDSWLNNGEAGDLISTELPPLSQQHGAGDKKEGGDDSMLQQNLSMLDDLSNDPNQQSNRNTMEKGIQASNLYLAKLRTFMSPSNSSTSHLSTPPVTVDTVSSVVSMLRGTLERKKLSSQSDNGMVDSGSFELYGAMGATPNMTSDQQAINQILGSPRTFLVPSTIQVKETGNLQMLEGSVDVDIDGLIPQNQIQSSLVSREPSQSESSAAALSTGFERGNLVRMGSVTSGVSVDRGDPTKKRRVERSRKMAEAKERNSTPIVPSDMQSILKRCENLEREVRSLKLNLSFMNRKDSEQTKQIEELEKQNENLIEEKERLLEEIERIISDPGKF